jgi:ATP-dependent RNA helicase DHX29
MAEHPVPEMLRLSLSDLALRTKIMKVDVGSSIEEVLSKALDPPSVQNIQRAVSSLVEAGALTATEEITGLGRYLAQLPTDVSLGKFLLIATVFKCLDPALTIAATLNSKSPFITPFGKEDEAERQKASFRTGMETPSPADITHVSLQTTLIFSQFTTHLQHGGGRVRTARTLREPCVARVS